MMQSISTAIQEYFVKRVKTYIDMALLSETQYLEKLQRIFKNVPFVKIKWAVRRFSNESEQNEYLRKLNQGL